MASTDLDRHADMGGVVSNEFGEHYLFGINRNLFQGTDASTVFRSCFKSLLEENTFFIVAGTDSGLLYQYIKAEGIPKGSRYLFVELPQVLELLINIDNSHEDIAVTTPDNWLPQAIKMDMPDYAIQDRLILFRSLGVIHGHCNDYPPLMRKLRDEFHVFTDSQKSALNSRPFTLRQISNLSENQIPAISLKGTFQDKTAVLLAGGPSLDDHLPWVKEHRHDLLVIAVSRISRSLLEAGIQPDICVSVDPYPVNINVSKEMLEFKEGTLLVNEYHLNANLLSSWGGDKAYIGPRYPWPMPLEPENMPPCIGTTVTNTAFALALETGVSQLILCGTDFCFSQTGYTHASGSAEHALGPSPMYGNQRVRTNSAMMADTTNAFLNSGKTIAKQAQEAVDQGCLVINPAPGAMMISNVEHLPLDIIELEPMELPAREIIATNLPAHNADVRNRLFKEELGEVDRVLAELKDIRKLSRLAISYNEKLFNSKERNAGFQHKKKLEQTEKEIDAKYADTSSFVKQFGISRFIPILRHHDESKKDIKENSRLYFQAYIDTTTELIEILRQAHNRVSSRIEEDKTEPDIEALLEQWQFDKQPGRARQWAQNHEECVNLLSEPQQQTLRDFINTFDDEVTKISHDYNAGINKNVELDGFPAKVREYFLCGDQSALTSLLAGLNEHSDQTQATYFTLLLQGYLAELRNEAAVAIEAYQKITEGPAHIDALMRLFALHTKDENLDLSLDVLKILSCISATFTPMYADLLQATGDIETSVEIYTEYILANPDDLNAMMKLGKLYQQCGATEGVVMSMNYILDKDPQNQTAITMLAAAS